MPPIVLTFQSQSIASSIRVSEGVVLETGVENSPSKPEQYMLSHTTDVAEWISIPVQIP